MASLIPSGSASGTGSMTLAAPVTNSNQTATLPDATGTVMVSGNMPAFAAYQSAGQAISSATYTKIQFQTEEFDTANAFDSTTNYRFQPLVAGYYQVNLSFSVPVAANANEVGIAIYKNNSFFKSGSDLKGTQVYYINMTSLIYLNGSTDYLEGFVYLATGATSGGNAQATCFQASLVRSA